LREQRRHLAAVMRLVVEQMGDQQPARPRPRRAVDLARVGERLDEPFRRQRPGPGGQPGIERFAFAAQGCETAVQVDAELGNDGRIPGKAGQEREVGIGDVVERRVHRAEEGAAIGAQIFLRQRRAERIETRVHPRVVARHRSAVLARDHRDRPCSEP